MSVAFRRESDEEHKEPRFELPLPPGPNLVTAQGLVLIERQVAALEANAADASLAAAEREDVLRRLRYWRTRQATAQPAPSPPPGEVAFGSRVRIVLDGRARVIDIVGGDEADPGSDRLAFFAPLARALIGGGAGDLIDFGGVTEAIEIVSTEPIPAKSGD